MTPAELIALAEKHNILIPNAFDKDSFEETSGWTDEKWERFINYYGYDENDDAIMESIEYFEEQEEEEKQEEEDRKNNCRCTGCGYTISKTDFDDGKGRVMFCLGEEHDRFWSPIYRCGVCDYRCDDEGELRTVIWASVEETKEAEKVIGMFISRCKKHQEEDEEDEEEEERYCDNVDCPYGGNCFGDLKKQHEGKPFICVGCTTGKGLQEQEEEKEEPEVIVDPEKLRLCYNYLQMTVDVTWGSWMIEGIPFDNIIVRGLTDRQLEVLGRFVNRCKKSD
jgi:hypothetical protein